MRKFISYFLIPISYFIRRWRMDRSRKREESPDFTGQDVLRESAGAAGVNPVDGQCHREIPPRKR